MYHEFMKRFLSGNAFDAYEYFGAHPMQGGCLFRVYAPNASEVSVIGDFCGWQPWYLGRDEYGVYSGFVENAAEGQFYKPDITNGLICMFYFLIGLIREIIKTKSLKHIFKLIHYDVSTALGLVK